ncbi:MAG: 4-hydroxythreonine-4-phosphate dehydrogenase PdxA [Thermodesulfobacteriota bacterium]
MSRSGPGPGPRIAITMGDPVGVGPEIILKALGDGRVRRAARPVVIGDVNVLGDVARRLGLKPPPRGSVVEVSALDPEGLAPGAPTEASSAAMIGYIERAVGFVLSGEADAVVTAPISKAAARVAGFSFPGHTEFLAHLTGTRDFVMMLGGAERRDLKVALTTIHVPLSEVPRLVTPSRVYRTIRITDEAFRRDFGVRAPRIAVAGLNPHAGEGGLFGDEDRKKIAPAVRRAVREGIDAAGPLPADTVFYRAAVRHDFDVVVAMYHDQGLGPLKLLHFDDGVNVTLGLPIIRTSVDHGTAYDIAWTGKASAESMVSAIRMAAGMARRRKGL